MSACVPLIAASYNADNRAVTSVIESDPPETLSRSIGARHFKITDNEIAAICSLTTFLQTIIFCVSTDTASRQHAFYRWNVLFIGAAGFIRREQRMQTNGS